MSIAFRCPDCAESYEVDDEMSGRIIKCRECNSLNRVALGGSQKSPLLPRIVRNRGPRLAFRHGLLVGAGLMTIGSAVVAVISLSQRAEQINRKDASTATALPSARLPATNGIADGQRQQWNQTRALEEQQRQRQAWIAEQQRQANSAAKAKQDEMQSQSKAAEREAKRQADLQKKSEQLRQILNEREELKRRQQAMSEHIALMSDWDIQTAARISRAIQKKDAQLTNVELEFVLKHWVIFAESPQAHNALIKKAHGLRFSSFCQKLGIDPRKNPDYAFDWIWDLGNARNCMRAVSISDWIAKRGLRNLPDDLKDFVFAHRKAFAPVLGN